MVYRGRFAPTPSGALHLGSMLTALASFLQAKAQQGQWLLRIDDLDTARVMPGAIDRILRTLSAFGLESDEKVYYQSQHRADYVDYLQQLINQQAAYRCDCSRKFLSQFPNAIYPKFCLTKSSLSEPFAWRLKVPEIAITINDQLQGIYTENLAQQIGDLIIQRRDQITAYNLAVVIDDYQQGISEIVRGADLLSCTGIQIYLQHLLKLTTVNYAHLPILVDLQHQKLSKQSCAPAVNCQSPQQVLYLLLQLLKQQPPNELLFLSVAEILTWAIDHWQIHRLRSISQLFIDPN
jgi:glutamyl-Q tRNA(Asp) synthetase